MIAKLVSISRTKEEFVQLLTSMLAIQVEKMNGVGFQLDSCLGCGNWRSREDVQELVKNYFELELTDCFCLMGEFIRLYPDFSPQGFEPHLVIVGDDRKPTISFRVKEDCIPKPKNL